MKKVFYVVAASLLMTSCLEDKMIEEYNEDFVSVFGNADPLHTWKMVDSKSVEVNLDKSSRVKIYVKVDNTYRLVADYENISGTRTLSFDAPMGCEDIYVTVDGVPYQKVKSRNGNEPEVPSLSHNVEKKFTYQDIKTFHNDGITLPETVDNRKKVKMGCKLISKGDGWYEFYPMYWGGAFNHGYGLYYYDENGIKVDVPFFTDHKAGGLIQRIVGEKEKVDEEKVSVDENGVSWIDVTADYAYNYFFVHTQNTTQNTTNKPTYDDSKVVLKSLGYRFYITPGTTFGFYVDITQIKENDRGRFYSDPDLNNKTSAVSNFAFLHKEIKNEDSNTLTSYITVEDFDDNDYNDFIFMLVGSHDHLTDKPIEYIYAVEDLGGTNDFDFNDVVFSVSHVAGKERAIVQPLAAGGIYSAEIRFTNSDDRTTNCGEIHKLFGVDTNVMVNTSSHTTADNMKLADPFYVPVGAEWSNTATSYGKSGNGFSVKVTIPGKTGDKVVEVSTSIPGGKNSAPQMLVLSGDWLWPTEKTSIAVAYPEFAYWVKDFVEGNHTWDDYPKGPVVNWK